MALEEQCTRAGVRDTQATQADIGVVAGTEGIRPTAHAGAGGVACRPTGTAVADAAQQGSYLLPARYTPVRRRRTAAGVACDAVGVRSYTLTTVQLMPSDSETVAWPLLAH